MLTGDVCGVACCGLLAHVVCCCHPVTLPRVLWAWFAGWQAVALFECLVAAACPVDCLGYCEEQEAADPECHGLTVSL